MRYGIRIANCGPNGGMSSKGFDALGAFFRPFLYLNKLRRNYAEDIRSGWSPAMGIRNSIIFSWGKTVACS